MKINLWWFAFPPKYETGTNFLLQNCMKMKIVHAHLHKRSTRSFMWIGLIQLRIIKCKHNNETSGSIKAGNLLINYKLLKKLSVLWI